MRAGSLFGSRGELGWGQHMHKKPPPERYAFDLPRKRERFKIHGNIAG